MAQSRVPFLDKFTKPRQPPPEIPQPPFSSSNTTEDFIDLDQIRVDDSQEEPKRSFIHQLSEVDIRDNDDFYLLQEERNARGCGSDGGDGNGTGGLSNPNPSPRSLSEILEDWHTNGWLTEILAVIASFACVVTIPVMLGIYNNEPVPRLPWDVSLNAVVSVLSTVAKSSLLCAICAALGQDKWDWYDDTAAAADSGNGHDQPHPQEQALYGQEENGNKSRWRTMTKKRRWLKEMGTLDQASRGPLGAVKILTNRRTAFSPASLGALVIILSLVVDPFTQQTVSFRERQRLVASDEVWAAQARAPLFCNANKVYWEQPTECGKAFQDAIYAAIWIEPETYKPITHAQCPSGDCKWEPFNTIEYCLTNGVIETPMGSCDLPSFNQSEFDDAYIRYNLTENSRGTMRYCDGLLEPLTRKYFFPESIFDLNDTRWEFGPLTFTDRVDARPEAGEFNDDVWSEYSVLTRFEMSFWGDEPHPNPLFMTTFPTEVITDLETTGKVGNLSEMHIPDAVVLMGHTRYDMLPQVYHVTTQSEITKRYQLMIELRVNMTDWSAPSICQVERTMSVVNGTAVSAITSSKYLQAAYRD
ncbi:hypothetical protein N0V85_001867 [Neurospora sp. IMI 360204]|nr:hypothetical protein N0V85_001867 [Neurospora sp. IMI 360204]